MAYDELGPLVADVNTEVAEVEAAKQSVVEAEQLLLAADAIKTAEEEQLEGKLMDLIGAVEARLREVRGEEAPVDPAP